MYIEDTNIFQKESRKRIQTISSAELTVRLNIVFVAGMLSSRCQLAYVFFTFKPSASLLVISFTKLLSHKR